MLTGDRAIRTHGFEVFTVRTLSAQVACTKQRPNSCWAGPSPSDRLMLHGLCVVSLQRLDFFDNERAGLDRILMGSAAKWT